MTAATPAQVTASAPGKIILMGEHAAVYGRPALVAALGLRTRVRVTRRGGDRVTLRLPDLDVVEVVDWAAIERCGDAARRAWESYAADPAALEASRVGADDPAHVVKVVLAETRRALRDAGAGEAAARAGLTLEGLEMEVASGLPLGAGFGSSASVAVAAAAALSILAGAERDDTLIGRIALEAERRQHGNPSGIDHGTVLRGGVLWMEPAGKGIVRSVALRLAPGVLQDLAIFHTGTPHESTGEVVEAVRRRFAGRRRELEGILAGMEARVRELRELLTGRPEPARLVALLRTFERHLESLGVVPEAVRRLVREIEEGGGAAKISGAGGLSEGRAGSLLVYHPERPAAELAPLAGRRRFEAELGAPGLEIESVA